MSPRAHCSQGIKKTRQVHVLLNHCHLTARGFPLSARVSDVAVFARLVFMRGREGRFPPLP